MSKKGSIDEIKQTKIAVDAESDLKVTENYSSDSKSSLTNSNKRENIQNSSSNNHWSVTEHGKIIAKATNYVYKLLIASKDEGGFKDFFMENCSVFDDTEEHKLVYMELYQEFEMLMEERLIRFAEVEGLSVLQLREAIETAVTENKAAEKSLGLLLAGLDYTKFLKMMKSKARQLRQDGDESHSHSNHSRGSGSGNRTDLAAQAKSHSRVLVEETKETHSDKADHDDTGDDGDDPDKAEDAEKKDAGGGRDGDLPNRWSVEDVVADNISDNEK